MSLESGPRAARPALMQALKPYPKYHDAGLRWVGKLPSTWKRRRLKTLFLEIDRRSATGEEKLLSLRMRRGLVGRTEAGGRPIDASALVGFKHVGSGQVVMNRMRAAAGLFAVASEPGVVSPDYAVFEPCPETDPVFFLHLFQTPQMKATFRAESKGLGTGDAGFLRLYSDRWGKQKLVKLLEEQKHAIVHRAVTRGLSPNVRLKPSGVKWLEDIPEHWELRRAKQVCSRIIDCRNRTPAFVKGGGYLVVRTTCIRKGRFDPEGGYSTDRDSYEIWTQRGAPREGDVFFTREAPAGEACLVPARGDLCMGQRMMYFRPDPELLDPEFLLLTIYGPVVRRYIDIGCSGSTVGHLRLGQVYALPLLWCPMSEQKRIVAYVTAETAGIDAAGERARAEIALLREYRTRLVSDVVTGQLDVRQAAAALPDEVNDTEPEVDELDEDNDDDASPVDEEPDE